MQILGVANSYASAPVNAPTSLSAVPASTSVAISFTAPTNDGGATITNYQYNINGGSFVALSPADATSPITISGLTAGTSYTATLEAVNIVGAGPASAGVSFTTLQVATGGIGAPVSVTIGGVNYQYLQFNSTGTLTVNDSRSFQVKLFGGGGSGGGGNGYNAFGRGGGPGAEANATATLGAGTYTVTIGAGSTDTSNYPTDYGAGPGSPSSFSSPSTTANGGAASGNGGANNGNGNAGVQLNTFIGGASLFKAAGGGNANSGIGGSGIGGNAVFGTGTAQSAAANTASGGGGAGGSNLPNLFTGTSGRGGSGIVYVRWVA
jgi:hypothetical protein